MIEHLALIPGITEAFKADSFKDKINLGVGAYRRSCIKTSFFLRGNR